MILKHWLNGRTINWIAAREGVSDETVINAIRKKWGK